MNDLLKQATIDFARKPPHEVGKRLPRMKIEGELAMKTGKHNVAFILLKRWLNTATWIKTTKEYKENPNYYNTSFLLDKEKEVKALFSEVEAKVAAILAPVKSEPEMEDKREVHVKSKGAPIDDILNLPETPTDEPLHKESEDFTSCLELFHLLKSKVWPLIIDVRSREDYEESRIKTNRCINIPADAITFGVLAQSYEKLFADDEQSLYLYERRGKDTTDVIVLLDWSTTSSTLFPGNKMIVLRDILKLWDPGMVAPKITILDGGYTEWLHRYPTLVTNPRVKGPNAETSAMDEILEEVEYPEWLNTDENSSPFSELRIQPSEKKDSRTRRGTDGRTVEDSIASRLTRDQISSTTARGSSSNRNENIGVSKKNFDAAEIRDPYRFVNEEISEISRYNRGKVPNNQTESMNVDEDGDDEMIFEANGPSYKSKSKPKIDRSSKPMNSTRNTSTAGKQLLTLKTQLNELLKNIERFENEILWIETEMYEQDENDNRITSERVNKEESKKRLKDLNITVAQLIHDKDQVKEALSRKSMKNVILSTAEENKKCQLELSIGGFEQRLRAISLKRQTLKEKSLNKEKEKINTLKLNENDVTKEPLKSDGSSANIGLKRSHSSPNLAQLDNGKVPLVDRSSKPRLPVTQIPSRVTISANSKLTWKDREQRMEPIFRDTRPGITGLKNLGNSCYMNSIIQCLSNNIRLAKYFNEDAYLDDLNKSLNICKQGQVADEVAHVIKALWRGQYKSISPRDLKVVIGQYRLQFDCNEQQDSHEFLVFLLDWLHNDLKKGVDFYSGGISIARKQWFKSLNNGESIISELFMGQLKSSIVCSACNNSSITYETFNSLTLSLPNTNRCTLDDCVKKFVTGQKVSGWTCDNCKVPREATKKFDFIKLPPTVVIHLNRFAESEGWLQKSNTSVDFPLTDLNLANYLVYDENSEDTQIQYDFHRMSLYAVSVHYGTMSGGHYTAYCRNVGQHKWYKYDDQLVSEVPPSEVKNQGTSAYLLFYTTIGNESYPYIQRTPLMKLGRL